MISNFFQQKKIILPPPDGHMAPIFSLKAHPLSVSLRSLVMISYQKFLSGQLCKICDIRLQVNSGWLEVARKWTEIFNIVVFSAFISLNAIWSINLRLPPQLLVLQMIFVLCWMFVALYDKRLNDWSLGEPSANYLTCQLIIHFNSVYL